MKGTAMRDAIEALTKIETLRHQRSETVHRGVGAVLTYLGARRLHTAAAAKADGAEDRRYLELLAGIEDAAIRLDGIPAQTERRDDRKAVWVEITARVGRVKALLLRERDMAQVRDRVSA